MPPVSQLHDGKRMDGVDLANLALL